MGAEWKNKTANRGSLVIGPLRKGERHEISTTDIQADEWLNMRNFYPTPRGLRRGPHVAAANSAGVNTAATATQSFQRSDLLYNYVALSDSAGYAMQDARTGFQLSQMCWSSMGSNTERNIIITIAGDTLSATIAGTYTADGVTYNYYFDASFMIEPGDRIFSPADPTLTSLIKSVSATTITFDATEHNVPATVTQLCILYKWQSATFPASLGYYIDTVNIGAVSDPGRIAASQQPTVIEPPVMLLTSLGRPLVFSSARNGQTAYSNRYGFEGYVALRDGGAAGTCGYPLDADTVIKSVSARTIEAFRGFVYLANTYEVGYATATGAAWAGVAYSPTLNVYAAITTGGKYAAVTSGTTWLMRLLPVEQNWTDVCWSVYLAAFVAIATGSSIIATSADGYTWVAHTLTGVVNGNKVCSIDTANLIAIAGDAGVYTLTDLHNITTVRNVSASYNYKAIATDAATVANTIGYNSAVGYRLTPIGSATTAVSGTIRAVCFNSNLLLFFRLNSAVIESSSDGVTWNAVGSIGATLSGAFMEFIPTHNTMVVVGYDASYYYAYVSDVTGATWSRSKRQSSLGHTIQSRIAVDGSGNCVYGVTSSVSYCYESTDGGTTWLTKTPPTSAGYARDVIYNTTTSAWIWATTTTLYSSANLTTWSVLGTAPAGVIANLAWSPTLSLYVVTTSNNIYSTPTGTTWTARVTTTTARTVNWWSTLGIFTVGYYTSVDGVAWITSTTNDYGTARAFYPAIGVFSTETGGVGGYSRLTLYGTAATLPSTANWTAAAYHVAAAIYVTVAYASDKAAYSADGGATWTAKTLPSSANWLSVCASSGIANKFVAVASGTTGASSADGSTWTARTLSETGTYRSVCYGATAGYFMAVANGNTVNTYSADGASWVDVSLFSTILWQQYGNRIRWSLSSNPRRFTNVTSYIDLPEQGGQIIKLLSDGQRMIAYLKTTIYYGVATNDPVAPFAFLKLETGGVGLEAQLGVCRIQNMHIFVGRNNVYLLDNLQLAQIGDQIVDPVIRKLNNNKVTQCFYDETANGIVFGFAVNSASAIDQIWLLKLDTKSWSCLRANRAIQCLSGYYVAESEQPYRHRAFAVSNGSAVLEQDQLTATTYEASLETGDLSFEFSDQVKEFFRLKLNIDENEFGVTRTASILFDVSYSTDFGKTYKRIADQLRIPINQQEGYVNFRAIGNFIRFKFVSSSNVAPYTITSYTIDMKMMQPAQTLKLAGGII